LLMLVVYLKIQVEFVVVVELVACSYEIQDFVRKEMFQDLLRLKKREYIYISNHYRGHMGIFSKERKNTQSFKIKINK
jgi:hypothetical protein